MTLSAGTRLGPYEILGLIGAGGMGEVYKAKDTRLDRTVAIKVLPSHLTNPEHRARFEREAKAIAGLSHPNICSLFDVGTHDSLLFLVMEHLVGETLAERLRKGPLPIEQVLEYGRQIAEALSAAHRAGIIHRDLKPGNVMLTTAGVKLLDFGLAKLRAPVAQPAFASAGSFATQSESLTEHGTILGTLHYMAPERLEGKEPDSTTDIWALGVVLYEMVGGKRPFEGDSAASTIAAVLDRAAPPLTGGRTAVPPLLAAIVARCLEKDPSARWQSARDVAHQLTFLRDAHAVDTTAANPQRRRRGIRAPLLVAIGFALFTIGAAVSRVLAPAPSPSLGGISLDLNPAVLSESGTAKSDTPAGTRTALSWSRDGRTLVFSGERRGVVQLYLRELGAAGAKPVEGTEGGQMPVVSSDGQWIAYWADRKIKKVRLGGGPVADVASDLALPAGMTWDDAGDLFFGRIEDQRIWMVDPRGGMRPVTTRGVGEQGHVLPSLAEGRALLFTVRKHVLDWKGDEEVAVLTLADGRRKTLLTDASDARYVSTGHLLFMRRGSLMAVPFDVQRLEVRGAPQVLVASVAQAVSANQSQDITGAGHFAVSPTGAIAWVRRPVSDVSRSVLALVDRKGHVSPLPGVPQSFSGAVRLSPDGRRLAAPVGGVGIYDLERTTFTPVSPRGDTFVAVWWPGKSPRLVFDWLDAGKRLIAWQRADGSGQPQAIVSDDGIPASFTPDGRSMLVTHGGTERPEQSGVDLVTFESGDVRVKMLLERGVSPAVSPDGRWLAYEALMVNPPQVYVRQLLDSGFGTAVSLDGGNSPAWSPDGRELFFAVRKRGSTFVIMKATFASGTPPSIGRPEPLFEFDNQLIGFACTPVRCYDVAPDGKHFYAVYDPAASAPVPKVSHVNYIPNWFEELKAKVPTR